MKTAISIPDPIFEAAENLAARLGMSRSELYGNAINDYLKNNRYQNVTKILDEVYGANDSSVENEIHSMQIQSLPKDVW